MVNSLFARAIENACPAYSNLRNATSGHALAAREHCDDLWRDYAELADENFVSSFPLQLHERWFEMYLTVALQRAGLDVQCPKPGPDVLLTHGGRRIWIEATCATAGAPGLPDSVPQPRYWKPGETPEVTDRPTGAMTLRIRNSLDAKEQVVARYIANGIVPAGDVTAIAINVHSIPNAWVDMDDLMRRTLYGLGDLMISINRDTLEVIETMHAETPTISKKSGASVSVNPFVLGDGTIPHISAVLGSREDAANLPARLGDGFVVYPNLSAASDWAAGSIRLGEEWVPRHLADGAVDLNKVDHKAPRP